MLTLSMRGLKVRNPILKLYMMTGSRTARKGIAPKMVYWVLENGKESPNIS
jgi:hypothetical protein